MSEPIEAVIIGGGQAGLATAYHLGRAGVDCLVLEADGRIGDSWRNRWDSLRLFTPARYDGLPGLRFPAPPDSFPTKDEMADYLQAYVSTHRIHVRCGVRVTDLRGGPDGFQVVTDGETIRCRQVVVATGAYRTPSLPAYAGGLDSSIVQLHAAGYRRPDQLPEGPVLVVGAGNSGAEIALEAAAAGHLTWLSGRPVGQVPAPMYSFGGRGFWFFANHIASRRNPIGRKLLAKMEHHGGPLIRLARDEVLRAGVRPAARVEGVQGGRPLLEDGTVLEVAAVVWCTGFGRDPLGQNLPGVHFVGVPFQTRLASAFIGGVGADAGAIAGRVGRSRSAGPRPVSIPRSA